MRWSLSLTFAAGFNCTEEENTTSLADLRKRAWQTLRTKVDEQVAEPLMLGKLRGFFEERFRYDENGVPRVWKPMDDIKGIFQVAKGETLALVPLYSRITPEKPENAYELPDDSANEEDDFDFESSLVIFSETKAHDLQVKFGRDADVHYVEAERSTIAGFAQIPRWVYALLVILGWNEAMAILFNPIYFTLAIVALVTS